MSDPLDADKGQSFPPRRVMEGSPVNRHPRVVLVDGEGDLLDVDVRVGHGGVTR